MGVTMADVCDCGRTLKLHYRDPANYWRVQKLVEEMGPTVRLSVLGIGAWYVPRHYIAAHGVKAREVPQLAAKYGWAVAPHSWHDT